MYKATIFWRNGWLQKMGETPEEALKQFPSNDPNAPFAMEARWTYQPATGLIFLNAWHIPCGLIVKE